ncbi:MAG: hybrid sensor histidine kinase/response regulator, partial [Bacteroidota bacterium]
INGIHTSGNLLMDLVNDVLDLSRLDAGKLTLSMESVNVRQTIKKTFEVARTKAMQKEVHCSFSLDPRTPEMVETDASRLSQILMNLLSNAVKFTPQGKNVSLNVTMDADRLLLRVADEGPGITVEDQERIFLPYVQGNAEITRQFGGAGLGLSIVKRLVDLFGGTISVNSLPGEGSVFTVSLPVIPAISTNSQPVEQLPLSRVRFVSGQKILVVEDNPVNVQVMQGFLQELGLKVIVAGNGKEGIDMAIAHRPDVILMDIHMPVMNGIEALKVLVSMDMLRNIPIICLTADIFGEHRKNYLSLGFSDHLTKPVDFRDIVAVLEKYLVPERS